MSKKCAELFARALRDIRIIRNPHSGYLELKTSEWKQAKKEDFMSYAGERYYEYENMVESVRSITYRLLCMIFQYLIEKHKVELEFIKINSQPQIGNPIIFTLLDNKTNELIFFKEMETVPFWKSDGVEPQSIERIINDNNANGCKYVYLMYDHAYAQVASHNDDTKDPGRGTNIYALRWFFETYFEDENWNDFEELLKEYFVKLEDYIGYFPVKTLTANSAINFRKVTENILRHFEYKELLNIKQENNGKVFWLKDTEFKKIDKQFSTDNYLRIMIGNTDFAESLMTAEWLYDSMQKAKAIDLTVICTGYFKAVEQLMYELILNYQKDSCIELGELIQEDITLGSMANFFKIHKEHIFNKEIHFRTRKYVIENLFAYSRLRNGFFHKHNIKDINVIDKIKKETYYTIFLLVGTFGFSDANKIIADIREKTDKKDFQKLCEYVDYHRGSVFILKALNGHEVSARALPDVNARVVNDTNIEYTGIYFEGFHIPGEHLPQEVWLAMVGKDMLPQKKYMVYKDGKFIGNEITKEDGYTY